MYVCSQSHRRRCSQRWGAAVSGVSCPHGNDSKVMSRRPMFCTPARCRLCLHLALFPRGSLYPAPSASRFRGGPQLCLRYTQATPSFHTCTRSRGYGNIYTQPPLKKSSRCFFGRFAVPSPTETTCCLCGLVMYVQQWIVFPRSDVIRARAPATLCEYSKYYCCTFRSIACPWA